VLEGFRIGIVGGNISVLTEEHTREVSEGNMEAVLVVDGAWDDDAFRRGMTGGSSLREYRPVERMSLDLTTFVSWLAAFVHEFSIP
jgi:hypothetical protein